MGGLANLFKKLIPFLMIICLVSYGMLVIYGKENFTYLTKETINGTTQYKFDFFNYAKNISFKNLQLAIQNVIDIKGMEKTVNNFANIWKDGYKIGDVTKTGIAVIVLILNILITGLNVLIVPLRLIGGLVLTAMSIVGINVKNMENPLVVLNTALVNLYRTQNGQIVPLIPLIPYEAGTGNSTLNIVTTVPTI